MTTWHATWGVACNHHFLLLGEGADFHLIPGEYVLTVFGKTVAARRPAKLAEIRLAISEQQAGQLLINPDYGICFDWCAEQQAYLAHVQIRIRQALQHMKGGAVPSADIANAQE